MMEVVEQLFIAQVENLYEIMEFVAHGTEDVGLSPRKMMQLELITEELVVNISQHAYEGQGGNILVRICKEDAFLQLIFSDEGVAFDPTMAEEPNVDAALEEREIGGLGIYLVHKLVDKVEYQRLNHQNILTLTINKSDGECKII